jgi:hypothetical protein
MLGEIHEVWEQMKETIPDFSDLITKKSGKFFKILDLVKKQETLTSVIH